MITHIKTKNFMGADLDEDIGPKMIYTGENTAGKTKRSKAIILTILGFVPSPGKTIKIASDILDTLGNGQEMMTVITCGGFNFERWFIRDKKGSVKQKFKRNGKTRSKSAFMTELVKAGDPRVVDLDKFLSCSENAKIDALFELYPPEGNISTLDSDIEAAEKEISHLMEEKSEADNVISALIKNKNEIELPAGSLAETIEAIKKLTDQILEARENLKQIEIEEAKIKAVEDDKINTKAERKKTQAALDKKMEINTVGFRPADHSMTEKEKSDKNIEGYVAKTYGNQRVHDFASGKEMNDPAASIQNIIDMMESAGCSVCAAMIVAKMELRKYK